MLARSQVAQSSEENPQMPTKLPRATIPPVCHAATSACGALGSASARSQALVGEGVSLACCHDGSNCTLTRSQI